MLWEPIHAPSSLDGKAVNLVLNILLYDPENLLRDVSSFVDFMLELKYTELLLLSSKQWLVTVIILS